MKNEAETEVATCNTSEHDDNDMTMDTLRWTDEFWWRKAKHRCIKLNLHNVHTLFSSGFTSALLVPVLPLLFVVMMMGMRLSLGGRLLFFTNTVIMIIMMEGGGDDGH